MGRVEGGRGGEGGGRGERRREGGGNEGGYEVEWWSEMSVIACFLCC